MEIAGAWRKSSNHKSSVDGAFFNSENLEMNLENSEKMGSNPEI